MIVHMVEKGNGRWNGAEMSQRCRLSHDARHGIPKVVDGASMSARNLVHEGDKGDYAWHGWKCE